MTYILGVYADGHDPGACLLRDGEIVVAIEEERLTRVKHGVPAALSYLWSQFNARFGYFPWASVNYCLQTAGISLDRLEALVVRGIHDIGKVDWDAFIPIDPSKLIVANDPPGGGHHYCHALSAFYASPFDRAAVLVVDGIGSEDERGGESETGYLFEGRSGGYHEVFKNRYVVEPYHAPGDPARWGGIGMMYLVVSMALGFRCRVTGFDDAGKTMGLAPYGRPNDDFAAPWVERDGYRMDFSRFLELARSSGMWEEFVKGDKGGMLAREGHFGQQAKDLAYKVQAETEQSMIRLAEKLKYDTGAANLCLAGGVALNSVANGILQSRGLFERVFIQPAAADNGQAIGLAYYGHLQRSRTPIKPMRHAFGGRSYPEDEVRRFLDGCELPYRELASEDAAAGNAATDLAAGRIVGWCRGGSELGPRALGHRSILADPRRGEMKDIVNARVKFREAFRPFAPSVLAERAAEVFDLRGGDSPFMLIVAPVRAEWMLRIPAVTHVDGTGRVQTVDREVDPVYHALISRFAELTGVPVVLNTSFNLRGMPIVEAPRDILQCFLYTDMDVLYIGPFRLEQPGPRLLYPELHRGWELVVSQHRPLGDRSLELRLPAYRRGVTPRVVAVPNIENVDLERVCARLDGKHSLQDMLRDACPPGLSDSASPEVIRLLKRLLRDAVIRLRLGCETL